MSFEPPNLERLSGDLQLATDNGKVSDYFRTVWMRLVEAVEKQFQYIGSVQTNQASQIALIQSALAAAQAAQATANSAQTSADSGAVPGARSGSNTATLVLTGAAFIDGPSVALAGVSAGNLTITGTGPSGSGSASGAPLIGPHGEFRILENGVDIGFLGTWQSYLDPEGSGDIAITNDSVAAINAYVSARVTTGAVTYKLQFRRTGGISGPIVFDGYLFVRRA